MDRGETIVLDHAFGDEDGILEVVAVPRHERETHVLTQCQVTHVDGRAVGQDVAPRHLVTRAHDRTLVLTGVLVRTHVLGQVVDIDAGFTADDLVFVDTHNDALGVDGVDHATAARHGADAGVTGDESLHAGTYERLVGTQGRYRLTLHVRSHQGAVGIIVLEERNQRSGDRYDLTRRHVHQRDLVRCHEGGFTLVANLDQVVDQLVAFVDRRRSLGDDVVAFLDRRQMHDLVGQLTIHDLAVRCLEETVAVGLGVGRQRVDQADVRTFRRLDRAKTTVVRGVNVAHLEAGALTGQTARPERGHTTLVRDL